MKKGNKINSKLTKKRSKTIIISMSIIAVMCILFTTKASAFYDINGLIRQVNQEIQSFQSSFRSQIGNEISAYRNNLEVRWKREIETYRKNLEEQADREIQEANDKQNKEYLNRLEKEEKEANDRINRAKAKAEAELAEVYKSLDLIEGDE